MGGAAAMQRKLPIALLARMADQSQLPDVRADVEPVHPRKQRILVQARGAEAGLEKGPLDPRVHLVTPALLR